MYDFDCYEGEWEDYWQDDYEPLTPPGAYNPKHDPPEGEECPF